MLGVGGGGGGGGGPERLNYESYFVLALVLFCCGVSGTSSSRGNSFLIEMQVKDAYNTPLKFGPLLNFV